jgi:ribosomal protein S21
MVEIKRKRGESFEAFLRRFNKRIMQSGKILQFKKIKYHKKDISRNMQKKSALHRQKQSAKREYLKKIGKLPEEDYRRGRKRR